MSDVLLKVEGLKKYFKVGSAFRAANQKYLTAVDDISFEIKKVKHSAQLANQAVVNQLQADVFYVYTV